MNGVLNLFPRRPSQVVNDASDGHEFHSQTFSRYHSLVFTQIDANDPDAPFTLELTTSDEDRWLVTKCEPALDGQCLEALVDELNAAEDGLVQFVRDIRLMFATSMMEESAAGNT